MKLSIIVPIYNAEKYIEKAVNSIINQGLNDYELILINDGSKDNSLEIGLKLAEANSNIKLINQANSGPAKARNEGIKMATGDYTTFVDADDTISEGYYKTMLEIAQTFSPDIISSNINSVGHRKQIVNNALPKNIVLDSSDIKTFVLQNYYAGFLGNIPSLSNKFYKTLFLKNNNLLIDETRVRAEDYWFNFYAFSKANSCYAINQSFYNYNKLVEGSVMKSFRENQYDGFIRTRAELLEANKTLNIAIDYKKWDTEFVSHANEFILLAIKNNRWDVVSKVLSDKTFNECLLNYKPISLHTRLIKILQLNSLTLLSKTIYKLWASKIN